MKRHPPALGTPILALGLALAVPLAGIPAQEAPPDAPGGPPPALEAPAAPGTAPAPTTPAIPDAAPVAPQDQPDQRAGANNVAHHAASSVWCACLVCSLVS